MTKTYTNCPVEYTASIIGNKWKIIILRDLLTGTKEDLERDGILERKVYPVVPPKVEYSLTKKGNDLKDVINSMKNYGLKYKDIK